MDSADAEYEIPADPAQSCGRKTSFLETYATSYSKISLDFNGERLVYMPLALYDKDKATKCNKIKVRSACFAITYEPDGSIGITLYDKDTPSKGRATFEVKPDGSIVGMHREYALIRERYPTRKGSVVIPTRIRDRLATFKARARSCLAQSRASLCALSLEAVAENTALERLRYERYPRTLTTNSVKADWVEFHEAFARLNGMPRVIDRIMRENEVGSTSPYEVSDATIDASALSFGVRQLDIGSNDEAKRIFTKNLAEYKRSSEWDNIVEVKDFVYQVKFQQPIRRYSVSELLLLHRAVPVLNNAFRLAAAKQRYNDHHERYLSDETAEYSRLRARCPFDQSAYLALVAIDRRNQAPRSYREILSKASEFCQKGLPIQQIEIEITKSYGKYVYRANNIRKIVRETGLVQ
ncbi:hypothetical protein HPT29_020490 [Microvirga terrae]|uniref:Replication protein n=1 Tax=Microvirga terrae TaxID=2740529 RepID=A0ABY5RSA1_9HYPH|nr:hypothetical protein [Microvirga terrae]UVF18834.1 hypothetical protein HPT29_020490 [Microvirga terrae]